MNLNEIRIDNFRNIKHAEYKLGRINLMTGQGYLTIDEISRKVTNALNKLTMTSAKGENNNE